MKKPLRLVYILIYTSALNFCLASNCEKSPPSPPPPSVKDGYALVWYKEGEIDKPKISIDGNDYSDRLSRNGDCELVNSTMKINLKPGPHTILADNNIIKWSFPITVKEDECITVKIEAANSSSTAKSRVIINGGGESGKRTVAVKINGKVVGTIEDDSTGTNIFDDKNLNHRFEIFFDPGEHEYSAESLNGHKWGGKLTLRNGKSSGLVFMRFNQLPIPSGYCHIVFYSTTYKGVSVNLENEYIGTASGNFPDIDDRCIRKWVVSIVKPLGKYNYTATHNSGKNWSGNVNASISGECIVVRLP